MPLRALGAVEDSVLCIISKHEALCSGHGERRDEPFADEMHDPTVCAHIRPQQLCPVDRDTGSQRAGDGVCGEIAPGLGRGTDCLKLTVGREVKGEKKREKPGDAPRAKLFGNGAAHLLLQPANLSVSDGLFAMRERSRSKERKR